MASPAASGGCRPVTPGADRAVGPPEQYRIELFNAQGATVAVTTALAG
jgi:hypothetical protein